MVPDRLEYLATPANAGTGVESGVHLCCRNFDLGGYRCRRLPLHPMSKQDDRPLSRLCCERNPDPAGQRRRILGLLEQGADLGEADKNGVTPLHHAVRFRSVSAVATLLENGVEVNRTCKRSGSTPLHRAVTFTGAPGTAGREDERREIIRILLAAGADPSLSNAAGKTPLDYATDEATRQLLESSG